MPDVDAGLGEQDGTAQLQELVAEYEAKFGPIPLKCSPRQGPSSKRPRQPCGISVA